MVQSRGCKLDIRHGGSRIYIYIYDPLRPWHTHGLPPSVPSPPGGALCARPPAISRGGRTGAPSAVREGATPPDETETAPSSPATPGISNCPVLSAGPSQKRSPRACRASTTPFQSCIGTPRHSPVHPAFHSVPTSGPAWARSPPPVSKHGGCLIGSRLASAYPSPPGGGPAPKTTHPTGRAAANSRGGVRP